MLEGFSAAMKAAEASSGSPVALAVGNTEM
jgi:hypothetical protein